MFASRSCQERAKVQGDANKTRAASIQRHKHVVPVPRSAVADRRQTRTKKVRKNPGTKCAGMTEEERGMVEDQPRHMKLTNVDVHPHANPSLVVMLISKLAF